MNQIIPAPVIIPPKPHSSSFTNPNPPSHQTLLDKKPDPSSFTNPNQPCLQALSSDHKQKGVAMAETAATMVPINPNQTVTPKIGAPLTVTDTVVTKTESKNSAFISCDICNVTCNSETVFKTHLNGNKHKKKAQKLNSDKCFTKQVAVTEPLPASLPKQVDPVTEPSLAACLTKHVDPVSEPSPVACLTKEVDPVTEPLPACLTKQVDPVTEPLPACLPKHVEPVTEPLPASCQLCGVLYTSPDIRTRHISGKKHQKNLRKSGNQPLPCPTPVAAIPLQAAIVPLPDPMKEKGEVVASKRKDDGSLASDHVEANTKRLKIYGFSVTCKVCNEVYEDIAVFETHLASSQHQEMTMKQAQDRLNVHQL